MLILGLYLFTAIATLRLPACETGLGLNNPRIQENVFAHLAGPVMGPLAILMSIAVLASTAASLQSTFVAPRARCWPWVITAQYRRSSPVFAPLATHATRPFAQVWQRACST